MFLRALVIGFFIVSCFAGNSEGKLPAIDPAETSKVVSGSTPAVFSPEFSSDFSAAGKVFAETGGPPVTRVIEAPKRGVDWKGVFSQSALFLAIEQGYRAGTQPGTRDALKGEFFEDWFKSVKATGGWGDGDDFLTNYIGHPMEGSVAANIFVQNDPVGRRQVFSWDSRYWKSRLKAMAWTAIYSTQFELGPVSEASIGNVGSYGGSLSGAVDLVVTPLAGMGWEVGEDALDKYLITRIESWTGNKVLRMLARGVLNPTRSFANAMRLAVPWDRTTRPGIFNPRD